MSARYTLKMTVTLSSVSVLPLYLIISKLPAMVTVAALYTKYRQIISIVSELAVARTHRHSLADL